MQKKYMLLICLLAATAMASLCISGCKKNSPGKILVEIREYSGDMSGLEYGSWIGDKCDAIQGQSILSNSKQHISASVDHVYADGVRIIFSGDVVLPDKNISSNNFYLEKNKTYVFIAGGGISGTEIKIRYN